MEDYKTILVSSEFKTVSKLLASRNNLKTIINDMVSFTKKASVTGKKIDIKNVKILVAKIAFVMNKEIEFFNEETLFDEEKLTKLSGLDEVKLLSREANYGRFLVRENIKNIVEASANMDFYLLDSSDMETDNSLFVFDSIYDSNIQGDSFIRQVITDFPAIFRGIYNICKYKKYGADNTLAICYNLVAVKNRFWHKPLHGSIEKNFLKVMLRNIGRLRKMK